MEVFLQQVLNGITIGAVYSVIGVGFTLIFGIMRILNFAYGEFFMIATYIAFFAYKDFGIPLIFVLIIAMILLFCFGAITEKLIILPIRKKAKDWSAGVIMATLGLQVVLQSLALILGGGTFRGIASYLMGSLMIGPLIISYERLLILTISIFMLIATLLLINHTKLGLMMQAVAQNKEAAIVSGINPNKIYTISFGLSGLLVAVPGVLLMPILYAYPTVGQLPIMKAFAVTLLGGMGNIEGAIIGGFVLGIAEIFASAYISTLMKDGIAFAIMILVLIFYPSGLGQFIKRYKFSRSKI
ncbi:MAG: branched-chain amino acid ABC transporter permease [Deltaproteobacteria bacterium]|nr:branched-chain amino acid ABC transporter permease [Deltaproteobacteria bacterium]